MAELKPSKMPRDTALLHHQPGKVGRPGQYVGTLKVSRDVAKAAAAGSMWVTVRKRKGTAAGVTVLELSVATKWSDREVANPEDNEP
jgi:hypothetical protein